MTLIKRIFFVAVFQLILCNFALAQSNLEKLDSLGEYYFSQGQLDSSLYFHRQVQILARQTADSVAELNAYNWLFVLHFYLEKSDSLAVLLDQMAPLASRIIPSEARDYDILSGFWNYKSFYHHGRGELLERIDADQKALLLFEKQITYDTSELAILYQNLGVALEEVGDYSQANTYSKKALQLLRPSPLRTNLPLDSLKMIYTIGYQLTRLQDVEQANAYFQMGQDLADRLGRAKFAAAKEDAALFHIQWANNYFEWGKYSAADPLFERAQSILKTLASKTDTRLLLYRSMIHNRMAQGQFDQAQRLMRETFQIMEKDFPERDDQLALALELQAELFVSQKNYAAALPIYQRTLQLFCPDFETDEISSNPSPESITYAKHYLLRVLRKKGEALQGDGQLAVAMATYQEAIHLFQKIRQDYITEAARLQLAEQNIPLFERAAGLALALQQPELAFQLIEQSKALSLQEALRDEAAYALGNIPDALREKARQLQVQDVYWEKEAYHANLARDSATLTTAKDKLFAVRREKELLLEQIRREHPQFFEFKFRSEEISIADIRWQLLVPGSALLEYFVGEDQIFLFGITEDQLLVETFPRTGEVDTRIRQFAAILQLENNVRARQYAQEAYALFGSYLAPVLSKLNTPIEQLYIIPDGPFTYIPFEALLTQPATQDAYSTLPYLVKQYSCSYGYSTSLLLGAQRTGREYGKTFVGFAPAFGGAGAVAQRTGLSPLKYNVEAVQTLQKLTGGIGYTGQQATKVNLLAPSTAPLILHLSTHAVMDDENPMGSKIYLANGEDITTQEIYNLPYSCGMVVLSACETGTGKYYKGEGMMSLARAFMQSGSPSVMTSLWKVDDRSTSELMVKFYSHLQEGLSKPQALRRAQLDFMNAKESELLYHPYYWAAFIQIGDPAAIPFPNRWSFWPWLGLIVLVGGILWWWKKHQRHKEHTP